MKKTFSLVFALALVLALVSCGGSADAAMQIKAAFTAPFEYSVSTPSFGFEYTKTPESAVMVLDTPDTLKGLTVTRDKDGVTASKTSPALSPIFIRDILPRTFRTDWRSYSR